MPITTRSSRKDKSNEVESDGGYSGYSDSSSVEEEHAHDAAAGPTSSSRKLSREVRRKRRENIKSRNTGVGLSISTSKKANSSKKIMFDDDSDNQEELDDGDGQPDEHMADANKDDKGRDGSDDDSSDSDDDVIEEVKSSVARDKALEQLSRERETSKVQKLQTRTKKRKTKTVEEEEDDFDEDFFAQVDSEMAEQRKQRKIDKESNPPAGRHTTFLSAEEELDSLPIQADHNIELVVLGDADTEKNQVNALALQNTQDNVGIEPSEMSHLFARGQLASGRDQAKIKGTKKKKQTDPGWRRSKKMNALAFERAKVKRRKGRGMAAANFVVQP